MAELSLLLDAVVREERGRILGGLMRLSGSLDAAEEAFQEATLAALQRWPAGVPENPGAWLTTVARRSLLDRRRHQAMASAKAELLREDEMAPPDTLDSIHDDYLRLVFTCCHPDVSVESQIALTLKVVAGFSTEEIARAFLTSEATISQRILRARQTIAEKQLAYAPADARELPARLTAALGVVHALFNEGHTGRRGPLMRLDLQAEALRLGRLLGELLPREPEVFGLLALMAFGAARARTRVDGEGMPILLPAQDRSQWDRMILREGLVALGRARSLGGRGTHVLQAELSACHVTAPRWEDTDWDAIVGLYDELWKATRSPVVALNRAVALAMAGNPESGLAALETLETPLSEYHLFYATRAELLERTGGDPRPDLRRALALVTNEGERRLLERRLESTRSPRDLRED